MLPRLADLKCFVQDLGSHESYLTESKWAEVKMMVEVLQLLHAATIYFQKQDLTPGKCLLHWSEIMFKLENLDNNLASALSTALQSGQEFLLRKEAFLAAVWVNSVCRFSVATTYHYFLLISYSTQYWYAFVHLILFESRITAKVLAILGLTDLYNRDIIEFSFLIG